MSRGKKLGCVCASCNRRLCVTVGRTVLERTWGKRRARGKFGGSAMASDIMLYEWKQKRTPCPEAASELHRPLDRRLSAMPVPTFADIWCHVVRATYPYGRILSSLDRSRCIFFQVAPQLYSRGWVGLVPDPLLLRISGRAGNRTRTSWSVARNSDH
jgi:hypothetical protein